MTKQFYPKDRVNGEPIIDGKCVECIYFFEIAGTDLGKCMEKTLKNKNTNCNELCTQVEG